VFILFYLLVIKDNDPAVKTWPGRVRGNRQSFSHGLSNSCYKTPAVLLIKLCYS
jgi:hypothetical protein